MRCAYHPEKEAAVQCVRCKKPLCEECARSGEARQMVLCGTCIMEAAAASVGQAFDEMNEQKEARRQERELRRKRMSFIRIAVVLAFAVAILLANLYVYLMPGPPVERFDPKEDPYLTAVLIESGLLRYADGHKGEFPATLEELLADDYLPSDRITKEVLEGYTYTRPSPRSYELRIRGASDGPFSQVVFSQEGVDP